MVLSVAAAALAGSALAARPRVAVGWHDELNKPRRWTAFPPPNAAEKRVPRRGVMRLRIPPAAAQDPAPPFYWATVHRVAEVDLDRYPILAVRTTRLSGDTWWDFMVQEVQDGELVGPEYKTPSSREPGVLLYDLASETGLSGTRELRIRLNVARVTPGCWADYTYVRFLSRGEAASLAE